MENQILDAGLQSSNEPFEMPIVSKGTRFGNFLIDLFCAYGTIFLLMIGLIMLFPDLVESIADDSKGTSALSYAIAYSGMFIYYFGTEFFLKGRTIGKLITGTRAITTDFTYLSAGDAAKRTLSRFVPFEAFSFLGRYDNGWHDRWTDTMVVKNNDFEQYNRQL